MSDDDTIRLSDARRERGTPTQHYTLEVIHYEPNGVPELTIRGLGGSAAHLNLQSFTRDMLRAVLSFSAGSREEGVEQVTAVAFASIWTDGNVTTLVDTDLFQTIPRRLWLDRAISVIPHAFKDLLDSAHGVVGESNDNQDDGG